MNTQECEIERLEKLWLGFYDVISVALEDGSELPIWAVDRDQPAEYTKADSAKLLLVSAKPITRQCALEAQAQLKARTEIGWFFDIE
ncbi:MAG: hypothetical protein P0Y58_12250 [Candidatus Pseudomonas phytovorans]|uniref:Uncharacterized protein n=1 Tax=Candidatus Pseudomonas phytovorans TaxID=3121377 RepID=A0AAJ5WLN2_9PSED|nr:hypothetical protein [Pseudomonas sp.]WEK32922.1 MAG: hypothetical protein P0Y58_12250 [Pseudomonas sp.]